MGFFKCMQRQLLVIGLVSECNLWSLLFVNYPQDNNEYLL